MACRAVGICIHHLYGQCGSSEHLPGQLDEGDKIRDVLDAWCEGLRTYMRKRGYTYHEVGMTQRDILKTFPLPRDLVSPVPIRVLLKYCPYFVVVYYSRANGYDRDKDRVHLSELGNQDPVRGAKDATAELESAKRKFVDLATRARDALLSEQKRARVAEERVRELELSMLLKS